MILKKKMKKHGTTPTLSFFLCVLRIFYFKIIVELLEVAKKYTKYKYAFPISLLPPPNISYNHSTVSKPRKWQQHNPQSLLGFHWLYMHSFVYVFVCSSIQLCHVCGLEWLCKQSRYSTVLLSWDPSVTAL